MNDGGVHLSVSEANPRVVEYAGAGPLQSFARPKVAWWFTVWGEDENRITQMCIINASGPQDVRTLAPDGTWQYWRQRQRDGMLVFTAPDGYDGGPIGFCDDQRVQNLQPLPREIAEMMALGNPVSA